MIKGYYFITDSNLSKAGNISDVKNAIEAGVNVVQYRNKTGSNQETIDEALKLKKLCKNVIFLINDNIDVTLEVDADGVHLGQDDMPYEEARKLLGNNKIIGISVNNLDEAIKAEKAGVDYIGVGPIFPTLTKKDARKPCGVSLIKEIKQVCKISIVAIGGIGHENAQEVVDARADAICAISAVVAKDNVQKEIKKIQKLFK